MTASDRLLADILVVRTAIRTTPDDVRELYGELVERYRDEPAEHLVALRALGDEIRALEASGDLPKTLVTRSERHRRS